MGESQWCFIYSCVHKHYYCSVRLIVLRLLMTLLYTVNNDLSEIWSHEECVSVMVVIYIFAGYNIFRTDGKTSPIPPPPTQAVERSNMWNHEVADAVICQRIGHATEGRRPRCCTNQILKNQIPADEESHALAHSHVAVCVGRTCGLRHADAELCITHSCERE